MKYPAPLSAVVAALAVVAPPALAQTPPSPAPSAPPVAPAAPAAPAGAAEPFAFADFSWMPGNYGARERPLASGPFTGELRVDTAHPRIDGPTALAGTPPRRAPRRAQGVGRAGHGGRDARGLHHVPARAEPPRGERRASPARAPSLRPAGRPGRPRRDGLLIS